MVVNTNVEALSTSNNLNVNHANLARSLSRLSSGSKIVKPSDDAAGLAVSSRMQSQMSRLESAMNNITNAVSFTQTQDGYLKTVSSAFRRMGELTMLAQDATITDEDRGLYEKEFQELRRYVKDTAMTDYNGISLFSANNLKVTTDGEGKTFEMTGIDFNSVTYADVTADNRWQLFGSAWKTSKAGFTLNSAAWKLKTDAWQLQSAAYKLSSDSWYNATSDTWHTSDPGAGALKYVSGSYVFVDGTTIKSAPNNVTLSSIAANGSSVSSVAVGPTVVGNTTVQSAVTGLSVNTDKSYIVPSGNTIDGAKIDPPAQVTGVAFGGTVIAGATVNSVDNKWSNVGALADGNKVRFKGGVPGAVPPVNTSTVYYYKSADQRLYTDAAFTNLVDVTDASGSYTLVRDPMILTKAAHGFATGDRVKFSGTAPGGTVAGTTYHVKVVDAGKFTLHENAAAAASGDNPILFDDTTSTFTLDQNNSPVVTLGDSGYANGAQVKFVGSAPTGVVANQVYYVKKDSGDPNNKFTLHTDAALTSAALELDSSSTATYTLEGPLTDKLTLAGHGYSTGDVVQFDGAVPTSSPSVANSTNYYVRRIDENVFTLHANSGDANSGSNRIRFDVSASNFTLLGPATTAKISKANHGLSTGDAFKFNSTAPGGANTSDTYYARTIDANSFSVHSSSSAATAGTGAIVFNKSTASYALDMFTEKLTKTGHSYETGDVVRFVGGAPVATDPGPWFYVRKLDANTISLHSTGDGAVNNSDKVTFKEATSYNLFHASFMQKNSHGFLTGDSVKFGAAVVGSSPPVDATTNYFVRKRGDDGFTLHLSVADAQTGARAIGFESTMAAQTLVKNTPVLAKTSHGLTTGKVVRFTGAAPATPGATLSIGTDYFARRIDDNNFTLHATSGEASNGTNAIVLDSKNTAITVSYGSAAFTALANGSFVTTDIATGNTGNLASTQLKKYTSGQLTSTDALSNGLDSTQATALVKGSFVAADPKGNGDLGTADRSVVAAGTFVVVDPVVSGEDAEAAKYVAGNTVSSDIDLSAVATALGPVTLGTLAKASGALGLMRKAINQVSIDRATLGAIQSRLEFTNTQLMESRENLSAAVSRIADMDVAEETTRYARNQILVQMSTQMLREANNLTKTALDLLR